MSAPAARGTTSLLKRAWNEIPDIVAGSALAICGIVMAGIGVANYYAKDGDNRRYKLGYVVFRHDDPRAQKVRNDEDD
ncbi:GL26829 [Drosophila persimilis]|uniref:Uncharacterized protein NdufA3 n=2 Tax=pseudoobscura subgroup TaxID=32358 RepID=Q29GX9_DROPS|nr:uncharacterized protein LOC4815094 [Drosophila pseudoobscura]XP_002025029.1 uncharacterized protein LOC6599952 [Drosophila persimilis]XP_017155844.1 uncharacterized protein LOC108164546 [Drosophila miranda]EDW30517.1 GL26829 [Drosophila persimilis]